VEGTAEFRDATAEGFGGDSTGLQTYWTLSLPEVFLAMV
jgi:hypothetical protein